MKYLNSFNEAKQVGILYHYTNPDSLISIISDNKLKTGQYGWNYFTRNKFYHDKRDKVIDKGVRITFDGDLLSHNNKIQPYSSWVARDKTRHREKDISLWDEFEEKANDINNIIRYITNIEFDPTKCWVYYLRENLDQYNIIRGRNKAIDEYNGFVSVIRNLYPNIKVNFLYNNHEQKFLFDDNGYILKKKVEEEDD